MYQGYGHSTTRRPSGLETEFSGEGPDMPSDRMAKDTNPHGLEREWSGVGPDLPPAPPVYETSKGRHGQVQPDGSVKWEGGNPGGLAGMVGGSGAGLGPIGALIGPLMAYKSHLDKVTNRKYKATAKDYAQMAFPAQAGLFGKQGQSATMGRGHAKTGGIGGLFGQ